MISLINNFVLKFVHVRCIRFCMRSLICHVWYIKFYYRIYDLSFCYEIFNFVMELLFCMNVSNMMLIIGFIWMYQIWYWFTCFICIYDNVSLLIYWFYLCVWCYWFVVDKNCKFTINFATKILVAKFINFNEKYFRHWFATKIIFIIDQHRNSRVAIVWWKFISSIIRNKIQVFKFVRLILEIDDLSSWYAYRSNLKHNLCTLRGHSKIFVSTEIQTLDFKL